jgi:hypothetical protein
MAANIDAFEISFEEYASYFKRLENLGKVGHINSMADTSPVDK